MRTMLSVLLSTSLTLAVGSTMAEVYRVVDPDTGKVIFTDSPPENAGANTERVDLPKTNTQKPVKAPEKRVDEEDEDSASAGYESVEILQPRPDTTVPPGQLDLVVRVKVKPGLQDQHLVRVLWDGEAVAPPASTTSVVVEDMVRGTHRVQAQVVDEDGDVIESSGTIQVHVKRPSRLLP